MKDRFRFWGLYCGLILSFVLHYFATSQLKIYENHLWELFDSPKATIIMYLGNGLHAIYYVVAFLLMLFLCNMKNFKIIEELIFLALPALLLLVTGSIMTNLFLWVYTNSSYCIPFGAMLLSVFLYRIYAYEIRGEVLNLQTPHHFAYKVKYQLSDSLPLFFHNDHNNLHTSASALNPDA